ncbi:MAG: hypothetical protein BGO65_07725 [Afipia sp. 64-13]|nr:MAG: hypothetical protein BGO65_07725 [Afipia sp. 64-13]
MSNITTNRGAMSVNEFAIWAAIGRTTAWKEIKEGRLRPVKVCARTIVPMEEAERWLRSCSAPSNTSDGLVHKFSR